MIKNDNFLYLVIELWDVECIRAVTHHCSGKIKVIVFHFATIIGGLFTLLLPSPLSTLHPFIFIYIYLCLSIYIIKVEKLFIFLLVSSFCSIMILLFFSSRHLINLWNKTICLAFWVYLTISLFLHTIVGLPRMSKVLKHDWGSFAYNLVKGNFTK